MIAGGIEAFAGRRVLLLQGPVGPFFARLAHDLRRVGATVWKVNFHGGDILFQPGGMIYRGTMEDWPVWLGETIDALAIDALFLFGDCRPIHRSARAVAIRLGIEVGVFEEGYLRPDFITLERHGVNGNSLLPHRIATARARQPIPVAVRPMPRSYWPMVWWGFVYFAIGALTHALFPHYRHHRPLSAREAIPWIRSPLRKAWYAIAERGITARLCGEWSGRFFLAPLQVHNDAQVHGHANVGGIAGFIGLTIASFARNAPDDALLVLKHHPMDRGYRDYATLIRDEAANAGCSGRVIYVHDQHMPTILPHCRGMVVINSTAGLAAIGAGRPTMTVGAAIYDLPGLTFQGTLDAFWSEAHETLPDRAFYERFRDDLIALSQINGNFYRRLDRRSSATGLIWPPRSIGVNRPVPLRANGSGGPVAPVGAKLVPFPLKGSSNASLPARISGPAQT